MASLLSLVNSSEMVEEQFIDERNYNGAYFKS